MVAEWSLLYWKDPVAVVAAVPGRILSLIFCGLKNLYPVAVVAAVAAQI